MRNLNLVPVRPREVDILKYLQDGGRQLEGWGIRHKTQLAGDVGGDIVGHSVRDRGAVLSKYLILFSCYLRLLFAGEGHPSVDSDETWGGGGGGT